MYVEFEAYLDFGTRHRSCFSGCGKSVAIECQVFWTSYRFTELFGSSIIYCSTDLVPPHVCVCKEALVYWRCCSKCQHDGTQRAKLIIKPSTFSDVFGLESDLQATATHSKCHGVHINVIDLRRPVSYIVILRPNVHIVVDCGIFEMSWRVFVFEYRHIDLRLPSPPRSNVCSQCREADVGVRNLVRKEL